MLLVVDVGLELLPSVERLVVLRFHTSQLGFRVNTRFYYFDQLVLMLVFLVLDLLPSLVFDLPTFLRVLLQQLVFSLLKFEDLLVTFLCFFLVFKSVFFGLLLLFQVEFGDLFVVAAVLLFFLTQQLFVALVVREHLLLVLTLLLLQLLLVQKLQPFHLSLSLQLNPLLFLLHKLVLPVVLLLLSFDLRVQLVDLLLGLAQLLEVVDAVLLLQ